MTFAEHPLRRRMESEMHLRRFAPVAPPCDITQMVWLVEPGQREAEEKMLASPPIGLDSAELADERHAQMVGEGGVRFLFERHTEATTITAIAPRARKDDREALRRWMENWPGSVVRAIQITVEPDEAAAEKQLSDMLFHDEELVTCHIADGIRIWSDFRIHEGYGRLLVAANDTPPEALGRIVQRLQELGNYRNMALLGFTLVQEKGGALNRLEQRVFDYAQALHGESEKDDETLLDEITGLSAELALIRVETGFRLSATRAYAQIVSDRLDKLAIRPIKGFQSLADFTERRLLPAVRTCRSFGDRLDELAERTNGVIALLNTRIDTRIKAQNRDLLASMERSTSLQLRLQHLVEGLSVVAAGYYAVGLIGYLLGGVFAWRAGFGIELILGLLVLPVLLLIWLFVRYQRVRMIAGTPDTGDAGDATKPQANR